MDTRDRFVIHVNFGALLGCAYLLSPFMKLKSGKKEEKTRDWINIFISLIP